MVIMGTGSALPRRIVTNYELEKIVDTSDEWIKERTGIQKRHIMTGETLAELAQKAAERALESAGKTAGQVDLILVASISSRERFPCLACQVQERIGAENAAAFNISAACGGFLIACNTAYCYLKSGMYKNALIIGAEALSTITDWTDRSTCVLFGDGAGAVYVEWDEKKPYIPLQGAKGDGNGYLHCETLTGSSPFQDKEETGEEASIFMKMNGQAVYKFAVTESPKCIRKVLEAAGKKEEEIDYFILHQANLRILEGIARRLKQPMEKFPVNVDKNGNISAACLPVLLDEMNRDGRLKRGQKLILSAFGAGFTYGAVYMEW